MKALLLNGSSKGPQFRFTDSQIYKMKARKWFEMI